jgi:hypothetical protein
MANYISMYLGSSSTFHEFIDLYIYTDGVNLWKNRRPGLKKNTTVKKLTRRSQAFFGISFRSERRSSCSFSNSSFPIGPTADSFTGLSLNDLHSILKWVHCANMLGRSSNYHFTNTRFRYCCLSTSKYATYFSEVNEHNYGTSNSIQSRFLTRF